MKNIKQQIKERDNYTCQSCGIKRKYQLLHVHHIDGNGSSKKGKKLRIKKQNNKLSNLITYCNQCHSALHESQRVFKEIFIKLLYVL